MKYRSDTPAPVIYRFFPFITHSSPSFSAVVITFAASDPAKGSVMHTAPNLSPLASCGSHFSFCSSVANRNICSNPASIDTTKTCPTAYNLPSCSATIQEPVAPNSKPPYCLGIPTPK